MNNVAATVTSIALVGLSLTACAGSESDQLGDGSSLAPRMTASACQNFDTGALADALEDSPLDVSPVVTASGDDTCNLVLGDRSSQGPSGQMEIRNVGVNDLSVSAAAQDEFVVDNVTCEITGPEAGLTSGSYARCRSANSGFLFMAIDVTAPSYVDAVIKVSEWKRVWEALVPAVFESIRTKG